MVQFAAGEMLKIELLADNPVSGFHCHNIWQLAVGMMQPLR
tara:strand:+ start:242185 stop:242307 length:123 start_codon:yes stop_codon:yes gene_type:complete